MFRDVERPKPGPTEVVIAVKAAGINFAELEMTKGRYPATKKVPFVMGFEAAGDVVEVGERADNVRVGDSVTAIVSSGGYAEYATAEASALIPVPKGITYAQATTIPIHGLTVYALLKLAAKPNAGESILIQAAAGGVGLYFGSVGKDLWCEENYCVGECARKA